MLFIFAINALLGSLTFIALFLIMINTFPLRDSFKCTLIFTLPYLLGGLYGLFFSIGYFLS